MAGLEVADSAYRSLHTTTAEESRRTSNPREDRESFLASRLRTLRIHHSTPPRRKHPGTAPIALQAPVNAEKAAGTRVGNKVTQVPRRSAGGVRHVSGCSESSREVAFSMLQGVL